MISSISVLFRWLFNLLVNCWYRWTGPILTLDHGTQVRVGPKLGEGGFSFVYRAEVVEQGDNDKDRSKLKPQKQYALKRIFFGSDNELRQSCLKEVDVHHSANHPNLMPLLGFLKTNDCCYMLFPLCASSLREEVNRRTRILDPIPVQKMDAPWSELQALQIFVRICSAVQALHDARYTHRDIKLENILLSRRETIDVEPVLMDFGSAGPLSVSLPTRKDILATVELAAQHTTLPYRPPELLDGILQVGDVLDYRPVDVWSLGCTWFAILYGASPMECEFRRNGASGARIVEATSLRILNANLNWAPPRENPAEAWYSKDLTIDLLPSLLQQNRHQRPTLPTILSQLVTLIEARGGKVPSYLLSSTSHV